MLNLVFERALKELPGSYKLWYNYLKVTYDFFCYVCPYFCQLMKQTGAELGQAQPKL